MKPKVSVMVMVYNSSAYLAECLDSLRKQSFFNFEVLLVDDASTDDSLSICEHYESIDRRFRIIHFDENKGLSYCRAAALNECQGEYVAILDSDDTACPTRFAKQVALLNQHDEVVITASYFKVIDENSSLISETQRVPNTESEILWRIAFGNCLAHSTVMVKRQPAVECGGYNADLSAGEDMEFYSRILTLGKVKIIPEVLAHYRKHTDNKHIIEPSDNKKDYESIVQQSIKRHLKQSVSLYAASAVVDNYLTPAKDIHVFKEALQLIVNAPDNLQSYKGETFSDTSLLKRNALLGLLRLRQRNKKEDWWKEGFKDWQRAVKELSKKDKPYYWFTDFELFSPVMKIGRREIFPLISTIFV